jgi:hypothetical protein
MSGFFRKKYNQVNSSVVNKMQYHLFTIFPLSGPFAEFGFVFIDFKKPTMQFYCQNTSRPKKDTKLCLRVEKWSRLV